ASGSFKVIYGD
nr:Chain E, ALA-SER-GLY-SER-PHE-LYS-VAL-ILE-TYR-GLY-ASP [Nanoarchaeum equitans]5OXW_F Chain F, ALA-SER-GLY-SER-PHE-LYS-VAL-ILE-TYR-GLY-ASP [Nanoarchaeum equitans]5OXW_G Chain G, ALA-SER-GLY-SER-PHE-LYS-VAL-ILE-TYR-GLY-ASP [Nanoarchaeum equitans]5OXW_H Chain H, ALA-SER-GLY-SER-PHE-LYS-VAL-ILE-TYR-GLY-ASP [Nanoarchaeum equitans]